MQKRQGITAKDIAEACNVSQATVSYVINHTAGKRVSEAKRQEILQMAKELNYFPNRSAKDIRKQSCSSIGLICNSYQNIGFGNVLKGIKEILDAKGYTLTMLSVNADNDSEEVLRYYYSNIIAGAIYIAFDTQRLNTTALEENNIPFVVIDENGVRCNCFMPEKAFDKVLCDCIQFCKDNNLRRIRYFTRSLDGKILRNKFRPLTKALESTYPEADFERIICDVRKRTDDEIYNPITEYLSTHDFDIAITSNYNIGMIMQKCILARGFSLPQKPLHICLGSSPFLRKTYPAISSLHIPLYEMGLYASELILSLINDAPIAVKDFKCELIHEDTTII